MKRKLLFAMLCIVSALGFNAKAQLTDGTVYWIQDTSTGQFISQGANWGTQATIQEVGGLGWQAVYVSDGVYKLKNIMWNKVNNADLGLRTSDRFCDQAAEDVTLIASGAGYKINTTNGGYLCNNGDSNGDGVKRLGSTTDEAEATVWKFLTKSEYDAAIQAYKDGNAAIYATKLGYTAITVAGLETILATDYMAKDYTNSITNPTLGSAWDGWTHAAASGSNRSEGAGIGQGCAEFWNGCGTAKQEVSGLPNGLYKVEFVGTFRPKTNTDSEKCASEFASSPAFVYANDAKIEFLHWIDVPAKANGRSGITKANGYGQSFYTYVTDGTLSLGVVQGCWENGNMWCPFGQFTLTYYSDQVADEDITALVATIPTVPGAVASTLTNLKNTLESSKTIAAYNALQNAITAANVFVAPYAAYNVAAEDAAIAGVAAAIINEQNAAVEEATTVDEINACTTALRTAIAATTSFDITTFTITNPSPYANGDGWIATNGTRLSDWASNPVTYDAGNKCAEMWSNRGATMLYTITNLPAGAYRLTAIAGARNNSGGVLKVGDKTIELVNVGSVNSRADAKTWFENGGGVNELFFTLDNPTAKLTIGLVAGSYDDAWTLWQSFKLETFTETVAASYLKPGYDEALAAAQEYQSVDMFDADKTALNTAISENTVDPATATIAAYETAVVNLNAAAAAAAVAADKYARYNSIVTAIGENTNVDLTSFVTNADFQLNNLNGWTSVDGGNVANNGNFNSTYFVERWKNGVALGSGSLTHDAIVLPAGVYCITADAQNIEQYNSAVGGTGLFLCANEEQTEIGAKGNYSVFIKVADKTPLTIKFLQDNCSGNWIAYDNVTLTYVAADYVYATVDGKMKATVSEAQSAAVNAFEAAQTAANYKVLVAAIAAAQASKDAYAAAAAALTKANDILNSTNVYTAEARTAYADAIATAQAAYDDASMDDATANGLNAALNTADWGAAQTLGAAYIGSAWSGTNIVYNFWSLEGDAEGSSGMTTPFIQYWVDDAEKLADNNISATLSGLENGLYSVTAFMRVTNKKEGDDAGYDGISFAVNDGTPVAFAEATEYSDGWAKEITAEGLVKDGSLVIKVAIEGTNASWVAFKNVKYTKVRDLTPEEMATAPTAIALFNGENEVTEPIALDATTQTVTLTPSYTPANATEGYISWASSDETVATVADGVVTAVSTGTATITATSTLDATVSASAIVNVSFPETAVVASTYTNNGATRTVVTLGDNLIKNGTFEYPNSYYAWTNGANGDLIADNFDIVTDGDNKYLKAKFSDGAGSAKSICTLWPIEANKTYVFGYKVKASTTVSDKSKFLVVSMTNTAGTESAKVSKDDENVNTAWNSIEYKFTNTDGYAYVQFRARWLANALSFDDFYLQEVTGETIEGNVQYALDAIPTANIGEGIFQYSQAAIDAANALVQGTATVADVEAAYEAVTTLNAPEAEKRYALTILDNGKAWDGNAVTFIAGARSDQGGYGIKYFAPANKNLAQALKLTHVSGNKYKLSIKTAAGNEQYMTTAKLGYNTGANEQIRTTDDISKALEVEIRATANDGEFQLFNTAANKVIANNDNNDVYTSRTANFTIAEAEAASIVINTTAAGWGTTMLPFAVASLPDGVKAYTCAEVDNTKLTLVEVTALEANKPYIIEGAWDETLTGDAQGTALTYTEGLLTGVYAAQAIPVGSYGLQDQGDGAAFYLVDNTVTKKITANHAYLTVHSSNGVKAFYFGDTETAIKSVFDGVAAGDIYDLNGRKVTRMQKGGIYVVNGRKVMVK